MISLVVPELVKLFLDIWKHHYFRVYSVNLDTLHKSYFSVFYLQHLAKAGHIHPLIKSVAPYFFVLQ